MDFSLQTYYPVLIYLAVVLAFAAANLLITHYFLKPWKRTPVKLMPYESGMDPIGSARHRFDVKFYLIAILFLVFDVELLFLYPWAVATNLEFGEPPAPLVPGELQGPIFWVVLVFLATLAVAYVYAWRKGVFQWR